MIEIIAIGLLFAIFVIVLQVRVSLISILARIEQREIKPVEVVKAKVKTLERPRRALRKKSEPRPSISETLADIYDKENA